MFIFLLHRSSVSNHHPNFFPLLGSLFFWVEALPAYLLPLFLVLTLCYRMRPLFFSERNSLSLSCIAFLPLIHSLYLTSLFFCLSCSLISSLCHISLFSLSHSVSLTHFFSLSHSLFLLHISFSVSLSFTHSHIFFLSLTLSHLLSCIFSLSLSLYHPLSSVFLSLSVTPSLFLSLSHSLFLSHTSLFCHSHLFFILSYTPLFRSHLAHRFFSLSLSLSLTHSLLSLTSHLISFSGDILSPTTSFSWVVFYFSLPPPQHLHFSLFQIRYFLFLPVSSRISASLSSHFHLHVYFSSNLRRLLCFPLLKHRPARAQRKKKHH
ncbi:unnamed protein product [Acanthosepion pharaonis]|uniref:Uncharacterized protein n=1 Tax=Acanthosepion pharaonis TaxID=158019 RepID=A0A812DW06_ACAPH|nr:unnamed protein product [Sepia pharaonis]